MYQKRGRSNLILIIGISLVLIISLNLVSASLLGDINNFIKTFFGYGNNPELEGELHQLGIFSSGAPTVPVYRFYNNNISSHFYTISEAEKEKLKINFSYVYIYEGPVFFAYATQANSTFPVYRLYNKNIGSHFYTISESEKNNLLTNYPSVFIDEGPVFYAFATQASGTLPVYRFYNKNVGTHFYTISESEKDKIIINFSAIYAYEGPVFYAYASNAASIKNCSDGTNYSNCSLTIPNYCDNGILTNNCSICGCQSNYACQSNGTCSSLAAKRLISHWKFEGNANDFISINNGIIYGSQSTVWGVSGSGYIFDGVNDYISIPHNPILNFNDSITLSAWIKPISVLNYPGIISKGGFAVPGYSIFVLPDSSLFFDLVELNSIRHTYSPNNTKIQLNNWSHILVTYNGSIQKVYINGNEVGTGLMGKFLIGNNSNVLEIGHLSAIGGYFNGTIDEVKIWNYALNSAEIKKEYDSIKLRKCNDGTDYSTCSLKLPIYCNNGSLVLNCSKCGCASNSTCMPNGSCNLTKQCTDGTNYGLCSTTMPKFCYNGSLVLNCSKCGCASNSTCMPNGSCNLTKQCTDGTNYGLCSTTMPKFCYNGSLVLNCSKCGCASNSTCMPNGSCNFTRKCTDGTSFVSCSTTKPKFCNNGSLVLNCSKCGCISTHTCQSNGSCLSISAKRLISYWQLDGNAKDFIGTNDGSVLGAVSTTGILGNAYTFDGINDYISIPHSKSLDINESITLSAWVKPLGWKNYPGIIAKGYATLGGYSVHVRGDYSLFFEIDEASSVRHYYNPTNIKLQLKNWSHVLFTYNGSVQKVYINGNEVGTGLIGKFLIGNNTQVLEIGHLPGIGYFNGTIDEVKIWNYALNATEIKKEYELIASPQLNCTKCPDLNNDGKINDTDKLLFTNCVYFGAGCSLADFDLNNDGVINIYGDVPCFTKYLGNNTREIPLCVSKVNVSVVTIKDVYYINEIVELTDPPTPVSTPISTLKELKNKEGYLSNLYEEIKYSVGDITVENKEFDSFSIETNIKPVTISPREVLKNETRIIKLKKRINHLSFTGEVTIEEDGGYLRLIAREDNQSDYLIFSSDPIINKKGTYRFEDFCEETCISGLRKFDRIVIESKAASIYLKNLNYFEESQNPKFQTNIKEMEELQIKEKIEEINKNNKEQNLNWTAGQTSLSNLSYEEKKKIFGGKLPNLYGFEYYKEGIFEIPSLDSAGKLTGNAIVQETSSIIPKSFSWRYAHQENWMTSVKNQGECGSCWLHASNGATEGLINVYFNKHIDVDLSELEFLSSKCCPECGSCSGGSPDLALNYIKQKGSVDSPTYLSHLLNFDCNGYQDKRWKISGVNSYYYLDPIDINIIKTSLIQNGPMVLSVLSWDHAVTLVGYLTDTDGVPIWLIKNSWGTDWGSSGYGQIKHNSEDMYFYAPRAPIKAPLGVNTTINCVDKDGDKYCNWGVSQVKPSSCPLTCKNVKDFDDNNASIGSIETVISSCTKIEFPGFYSLNSNISTVYTSRDCIFINSPNVVFDCKDNSIIRKTNTQIGILVNGSNVIIKNCNVIDFTDGIKVLEKSENNIFEHNKIISSLLGSKGFNLLSSNNKIYNNYLKTDIGLTSSYKNALNTSFSFGQNIIKPRDYVAGNYWANFVGTGFSQTCFDSDSNGICDSANIFDSNNIDYLPLSSQYCGDGLKQGTEECEISDTFCGRGFECTLSCRCVPIKSQITSLDNENITARILLKVQKSSSGSWLDIKTIVDSPISITKITNIGLDTLWANSGYYQPTQAGEYRAYAELRKSNGEIMRDNEGKPLVSFYNFTVN